jgi:hypothetical protein
VAVHVGAVGYGQGDQTTPRLRQTTQDFEELDILCQRGFTVMDASVRKEFVDFIQDDEKRSALP